MSLPSVRLTIAIPTYNFGRFIGTTLDSILPQLTEGTEVVVVDGASTDDTSVVVSQRQAHFPRLRYERLKAKGGIDRDMSEAVDLARGKYCWLFSADDIMNPGAIRTMLEQTLGGADVYLCTHGHATVDLQPLSEDYPVLDCSEVSRFELSDPKQRLRYCELAETTEAFFSFMGTLIVRRAKWRSEPLDERYVGTCWAHAARLLKFTRSGLNVTYIPDPLLTRRDGNDSFATEGLVKRYALGIDGYHRIADEIFGPESAEAFHIKRVVRNEFDLRSFIRAKSVAPLRRADQAQLNRLARKCILDGSWSGRLAYGLYRASPKAALRVARGLRKSFQSLRRPRRSFEALP